MINFCLQFFYACVFCLIKCLESIMQSEKKNHKPRRSTMVGVLVTEGELAQEREQLVPKKKATANLQASSADDNELAQQEKETQLSEQCDNLMHLLEGIGENKNFSI